MAEVPQPKYVNRSVGCYGNGQSIFVHSFSLAPFLSSFHLLRQNSPTNPTITIRFRAPMKLLPRCLRHWIARCLHSRLPSLPHDLHRLRRRWTYLLLRLEWHQHLLLLPHLSIPRCSREVYGVGQSIPRCLSCASRYPNSHHPPFLLCCSRRFCDKAVEYLWPYPRLCPCYFLC